MENEKRSVLLNPIILGDFSIFAKEYGFKRSALLNYAMLRLMFDGVDSEEMNHAMNNYFKKIEK
jgi:hypothetical protein